MGASSDMSASFDEKVEALRRLREKRLAKAAKEKLAEESKAPLSTGRQPGDDSAKEDEGTSQAGAGAGLQESRVDPAGPGGVAEADALFCAGHCHERGLHGCSIDLKAAAEMYTLAAEQGHAVAQWRLGELCESGHEGQLPRDGKQAAHWYGLAAEAGNAQAQNALALLLEDGRDGVLQDDVAARRWHLAAAEQGNALSQYCLACLLVEGRGGSKDAEAAEQWLERSAAHGFRPACQTLEAARPKQAWTQAPAGDLEGCTDSSDLLGLAQRIAQQLGDLDDDEAGVLLDELMAEVPSLLDARCGLGDACDVSSDEDDAEFGKKDELTFEDSSGSCQEDA